MITVTTIAELRGHLARTRAAGRRIALVPTMGALHEGHLRLCDLARSHADDVVVSIFVNPLQFGPGEDFDRYPRDLDRDDRLVDQRSVSFLFVPGAQEIYPDGRVAVRVHAPELSSVLCGRLRPGHFEGVLTVVAKLFNVVGPDCAVFGQKDLQQAVLIRRLAHDLDFAIDVLLAPIVRDPDNLAMSSRNAYLSDAERRSARALHAALRAAQREYDRGVTEPDAVASAARAILNAEPGVSPQYVEVVDVQSLLTPEQAERGHAVALAACVGRTRLIDNIILE